MHMKLVFLGTSAGIPTRLRNVNAILLDLQQANHAEIWLFDCGEGTQHQILRTTYHSSKLKKIFITHLHGDHIFGLPGLLCSRSMGGNVSPLIIYGPEGIREFIKTSLRLSCSCTDYSINVVEITDGLVFKNEYYSVLAFLLNHTIECYGYRIEEHDKPGKLNATALKAAGVKPGPIFRQLKQGETVILDNNQVIRGIDYLSESLPGKKLAIFGDTAPCINSQILAKKVDLLVHEATLETSLEEKANSHGHSSTNQAAQLAKLAEVGKLIVTHVSSRYTKKGSTRLLQECKKIFPNSELATDFSSFIV